MRIFSLRNAAICSTAVMVMAIGVTTAKAAPIRLPLGLQVEMGPTLHPSGNDRLVENGKSGTQGKAQSDPDGNYNYGVDQNGQGGGLYTGDQDGNNGCGNDQDFEDDNNGNCGKAKTTECVDPSSTPTQDLPGKATTTHAKGKPFAAPVYCDDTSTTPPPPPPPSDDTSSSDPYDTSDWLTWFGK